TLYLERVHDNARHLLVLINDMLDLSKIEAGKLELQYHRVSLNELVTKTVEQVRSQALEKGLGLSIETSDVDLALETDPTRLRQILINLLANAIKFTPRGRVVVRLLAKDDHPNEPARVEVSDTGIGIPHELLEHVFEAFSQADSGTSRSFDGSGLGLAISRALCREMGYAIELKSTHRVGSTFSIVFP
ncbi:MAG: ATP-binding protein, partial [Acidobacteriota bacterium]|nr:ATP-binding protein [Acidobacteriota bacterium]